MELRELKYFLAVAREESISKAAEYLYLTQPSLTRQIQGMEKEIGQPLFVRAKRKMILTETGVLLRKRAEEIIDLYEKTEAELLRPFEVVGGDVYIGGGESYALQTIISAAREIQRENPGIKFHLFSGDTADVAERLDKGLIDFGILIEPADLSKYDYIRLPLSDIWGVLMRRDSPLAEKEFIMPQDLRGLPLICPRNIDKPNHIIREWLGLKEEPNVAATYNLIYNASLMVEEGMGYALGLDKLINTGGGCDLCFKPLFPRLESHLDIAWKKYQIFSKAAQIFLKNLRERL